LRVFIQIASDGRFDALILSGKPSQDQIVKTWEEIIKQNSRVNGDFEYESFLQLLQGYAMLLAEYTIVRAMLLKLAFVIDFPMIREVRLRGYKLVLTDSLSYAESISVCMRRVDSLVTQARMKYNELQRNYGEKKGGTKNANFEEVMAGLSMSLGFSVEDTITLSRFNEYKKMINRKNAQLQPHG
jgi:hypothetical protein